MRTWISTLALGLASAGLLCPDLRAAEQRVGITSAVNPSAVGTPPDGAARQLVIGGDVTFRERVVTTTDGQAQLLFLDQSALMVGPNSQVVIDEFVFDPDAGKGNIAATLTQGSFRYIGGKLSKQGNATLRTPVATIGIRGTDVTVTYDAVKNFLDVITTNGTAHVQSAGGAVDLRTGFRTTVSGGNQAPSSPDALTADGIAAANKQFEGQSGKTAGLVQVPTDVDVAGSGLGSIVEAQRLANIAPAAGGTRDVTTTAPLLDRATTIANEIVTTGTQTNATESGSGATIVGSAPPPPPPPPPPPTGSRTDQVLNGYVGGIGQTTTGDSVPQSYAVTNSLPTDVLIQTMPSQAGGQVYVKLQFRGVGASTWPPLSSATAELGDAPGEPSAGRSVFYDDTLFFASQRASNQTVTTANGVEERNASIEGVDAASSTFLYTVRAVDIQGSFPGVNFCACEYVTWGFWGGQLRGPLGNDRTEYIPVGTWVAGRLPDINDPTPQGSATFSGHAIGTVMRDGGAYLAAGSFTNAYNFNNRTGNVSIQNFDGHNVSGVVSAGQDWRHYSGSLSGSNLTGDIRGSFYGNRNAAGQLLPQNQPKETAGNFTLNGGSNYTASGIFAGKR